MIGAGVLKTLMAAGVGGLAVVREVLSHAGWYVRYQVNGTTREDDDPPAPGRSKTS